LITLIIKNVLCLCYSIGLQCNELVFPGNILNIDKMNEEMSANDNININIIYNEKQNDTLLSLSKPFWRK